MKAAGPAPSAHRVRCPPGGVGGGEAARRLGQSPGVALGLDRTVADRAVTSARHRSIVVPASTEIAQRRDGTRGVQGVRRVVPARPERLSLRGAVRAVARLADAVAGARRRRPDPRTHTAADAVEHVHSPPALACARSCPPLRCRSLAASRRSTPPPPADAPSRRRGSRERSEGALRIAASPRRRPEGARIARPAPSARDEGAAARSPADVAGGAVAPPAVSAVAVAP